MNEDEKDALFTDAIKIQNRFNDAAQKYRSAFEAKEAATKALSQASGELHAVITAMEAVAKQITQHSITVPDLIQDPSLARIFMETHEYGEICTALFRAAPKDQTSN